MTYTSSVMALLTAKERDAAASWYSTSEKPDLCLVFKPGSIVVVRPPDGAPVFAVTAVERAEPAIHSRDVVFFAGKWRDLVFILNFRLAMSVSDDVSADSDPDWPWGRIDVVVEPFACTFGLEERVNSSGTGNTLTSCMVRASLRSRYKAPDTRVYPPSAQFKALISRHKVRRRPYDDRDPIRLYYESLKAKLNRLENTEIIEAATFTLANPHREHAIACTAREAELEKEVAAMDTRNDERRALIKKLNAEMEDDDDLHREHYAITHKAKKVQRLFFAFADLHRRMRPQDTVERITDITGDTAASTLDNNNPWGR